MSSEMQSKEKTPGIMVSMMAVFFGFVAGWAYQFSGQVLYSDMLGISWPRLLVILAGGGFLLYLLARHFEFLFELFASVHFAAMLGLALALATILGTLIKQKVDFKEYIDTYGATGTRIIKNLYLDNVFYSHGFILLMGFMLIGLVAVTIKRKQFTSDKLGFLFAHAGVVILLIGGWIGMTKGREGMMELRQGQQKNSFFDQNSHSLINLDFAVQLKKFSIDYYTTEYKLDIFRFAQRYDPERAHREHKKNKKNKKNKKEHNDVKKILTFDVRDLLKNPIHSIPRSKYTLKFLRYYPHIGGKEKLIPVSDDTPIEKGGRIVRMASIEWIWNGKKESSDFFPSNPSRGYYASLDKKFLIYVTDVAPPKDLAQSFPSGTVPEVHWLMLSEVHSKEQHKKMNKHDHKTKRFQVKEGAEISFEGARIKILRYVPDFHIDLKSRRVTSKSATARNPALFLQVTRGSQSAKIWLFAAQAQAHGKEKLQKMGLAIHYMFVPENRGFDRYLLFFFQNKEIIELEKGKIVSRAPFGKAYKSKAFPFEITSFKVSKARRELELSNISDRALNPAIEVALLEGEKVVAKDWLIPRGQSTLYSPDGHYAAQMRKHQPIKIYKSRLAIIEKGKVVREKEIVVNDPLWYKGYAFYQSDHRGLEVSGLRVVFDQGLFLALLGMFLASLGVPYIFYVQPALRLKKKRALQQQNLKGK